MESIFFLNLLDTENQPLNITFLLTWVIVSYTFATSTVACHSSIPWVLTAYFITPLANLSNTFYISTKIHYAAFFQYINKINTLQAMSLTIPFPPTWLRFIISTFLSLHFFDIHLQQHLFTMVVRTILFHMNEAWSWTRNHLNSSNQRLHMPTWLILSFPLTRK